MVFFDDFKCFLHDVGHWIAFIGTPDVFSLSTFDKQICKRVNKQIYINIYIYIYTYIYVYSYIITKHAKTNGYCVPPGLKKQTLLHAHFRCNVSSKMCTRLPLFFFTHRVQNSFFSKIGWSNMYYQRRKVNKTTY